MTLLSFRAQKAYAFAFILCIFEFLGFLKNDHNLEVSGAVCGDDLSRKPIA